MFKIDSQIKSDVAKLSAYKLTGININPFDVTFVFTEKNTIHVTVAKEFSFSLDGKKEYWFDPAKNVQLPMVEISSFIFLRGHQCQTAKLERGNFQVIFEGGSRIRVKLTDDDFEPLEFAGIAGTSEKELAFFHVI